VVLIIDLVLVVISQSNCLRNLSEAKLCWFVSEAPIVVYFNLCWF
jgi:hypothetical protein